MSESVTLLLRRWSGGDEQALDDLMPVVYAELKRIADRYMGRETPSPTFSSTDLVSEAYEKLVVDNTPEFKDRVHFFAVAARYIWRSSRNRATACSVSRPRCNSLIATRVS